MVAKQSDKSDIAVIKEQVSTIKGDVRDIKDRMEKDYVTQDQFEPIKRLVYGTVTLVLSAVVLGVLALIMRK